jgi:putative endonuclease
MILSRKKPYSKRGLFNRSIGKWGENEAYKFLKQQGYKILRRNYRVMGGEIDLIVSKGDTLVFVEVKAQEGVGPISPEMRVGPVKQRQIIKKAKYYLSRTRKTYGEIRLDVISVCRTNSGPEISHIEGAFDAGQ